MSNPVFTISTISGQRTLVPMPKADRGPRSFPGQIVEWGSIRGVSSPSSGTGSRITLVDFDSLRERVKETANLSEGWDSSNAKPISAEAIAHAIALLDALESAKISPTRLIPTCDDSVLIRYPIHDQTIEWEFFSQGDNVRVQIESTGEKSYLEVSCDEIQSHI